MSEQSSASAQFSGASLTPAARPSNLLVLDQMPSLGSLYAKAILPDPKSAISKLAHKLPGNTPPTVNAVAYALEDVSYQVRGVRADPAHLERYQQLIGEPVDEYLPAGFVHVLAFPAAMAIMVRPGFPLPVAGMVHLSNRVLMARPVHYTEDLEVFAWAQNQAGHPKGTSVELVVEVRSQGQPVWRGESTYLAKGKYLKGRGEQAQRATFIPPVPTAQWQLTPHIAKQYATISGDRNPIHTSLIGAKAFGFAKPIAHGMYTAARALAQSRALRPDRFIWTVEFDRPVLLPGRVALSLTALERPGVSGSVDNHRGAQYSAWDTKTGKLFFSGQVAGF